MAHGNKILLGIQARSTSKRFPRKCFELIDGRPLLQHVINACNKAAEYHNKYSFKTQSEVHVAVLVPYGDEILGSFKRTMIFEGPEDDVLTRYFEAALKIKATHIVRVTGDCPLIPPFLISKFIKTTEINNYDYLSNVDEKLRTSIDGVDCEVMSMKALAWLNDHAKDPKDREHVTTLIRSKPPPWCKVGHVVGFFDLSPIKLSVDTPEDLARVNAHYGKIKEAIQTAERIYGSNCVHRF